MESRSKAHRPIRLGTGTATGVPQKFHSKQRISHDLKRSTAKHSTFDMTMPATLSPQRPTTTIDYQEGHRTSHLAQVMPSRLGLRRVILSRHITSHHIKSHRAQPVTRRYRYGYTPEATTPYRKTNTSQAKPISSDPTLEEGENRKTPYRSFPAIASWCVPETVETDRPRTMQYNAVQSLLPK